MIKTSNLIFKKRKRMNIQKKEENIMGKVCQTTSKKYQ